MSDNGRGGAVEGAVKVSSKVIDAISNPILIFLIVLVGFVLAGLFYIWHAQRVEALNAYVHLVDSCLPGTEKR